jgi:hypothetical protein
MLYLAPLHIGILSLFIVLFLNFLMPKWTDSYVINADVSKKVKACGKDKLHKNSLLLSVGLLKQMSHRSVLMRPKLKMNYI